MRATLILVDRRGNKHAVLAGDPIVKVPGLGTFDWEKLEGHVGQKIDIGGKSFLVMRASGQDLHDTMDREAQTFAAKDLASVLYGADILPGATIVEAGAGSGGLTVALARAVGPSGHVASYDLREDFLAVARQNVERAGAASIVEFRMGDVRQGIVEREVDAVVLDIPDPWAAVSAAWDALRPCGFLASFSPNVEQVKETMAAIRKKPFIAGRTIELIEREMEVRDVGVRPSFAPLGHTGYLTFARKVLDTF
jgi:tRNA (adenine57-N1/adenine58-N1)-methyltransferase